jgi:sialate O-acetylesterase
MIEYPQQNFLDYEGMKKYKEINAMRANQTSYRKWFICLACLIFLLSLQSAFADVKLPALISDNMILQRHIRIPIWGTADPGEKVTIMFGDQKIAVTADNDGKWIAKLKSMKAGGPFDMTVKGKNEIMLRNILIGDIWVCSGQSNMQWPVGASLNSDKEIAEAKYPMIRLFSVKLSVSDKPLKDTEGKWAMCSPETIPNFSAVGYFFGRDLHKSLNIPIGLINASWGGTPAESWTTKETLESDPDYKPILERWQQVVDSYPQAQQKYQEQLAQWEKDAQKAKDEGKEEPKKPNPPNPPLNNPWMPSGLYNSMISPLTLYAIKGAIWYQGESNADRAYQYRKLFPAMIKDWRKMWDQGDFPFFFVQLANFLATKPEPSESAWAELREAQLMTLSLPKTGMAVIIDIGEAGDIHPKNKQDVGNRLALSALSIAYGRSDDYSGPIYQSMKIVGKKTVLNFLHANSGLVAKGDGKLKGFAIAGSDKKFVWADAQIDGNTVIVWSDQIQEPIAVRYAWADNPECNLYNKADLPASPFRTDDWNGTTFDKK